MMFSYSPKSGWSTKVDPKMSLPGYVYISEADVRRQLGSALTRGMGVTRLRRFLDAENARPDHDGGLVVPGLDAMRMF